MNHNNENNNCSTAVNAFWQNTLPDRQLRNETNMQDDIPHIINRILTLAREIGCLSDYKVPVEDDSTSTLPKGSR